MGASIGAAVDRFVSELIAPKVDWRIVLRDFVERSARNDYQWSTPNRRYTHMGVYLPGLVSDEFPPIVIGVDTSGSIGQKELDQFSAEISGVLTAYDTAAHVIYCDAQVCAVDHFTSYDPVRLEPHGGGGTDFHPVFDWVDLQGIAPPCVVYLTDTYGTFPDAPPEYPALWVSTGGDRVPWGELVALGAMPC